MTPPASAASKPGSCGHTLCSAQTFEVTGSVVSLPSSCASAPGLAYTPRCECTSIRPGVTQRPLASTMRAPSGAASVRCRPPGRVPSTISTSPSSMRAPVPVSTVAPRISVGGLGIGRVGRREGDVAAGRVGGSEAGSGAAAGACGCAAQAAVAAPAAARRRRLSGLTATFYAIGARGTTPGRTAGVAAGPVQSRAPSP